MKVRFVADSMLGKLAKWLRVLGYDTHYQPFYRPGLLDGLVQEGRMLLSRNRTTVNRCASALLIQSDDVKDQLREMRDGHHIILDRSQWFSRCLTCNVPLEEPVNRDAHESVPEYVSYQCAAGIRYCPSCNRYFWPGSHRDRMIEQLEKWRL